MDVILIPLFEIIITILTLYMWAVIIMVILSWLYNFGVINSSNTFIASINDFLYRITEPALARLRKYLPHLGGFDIAPILLILLLLFVKGVIVQLTLRMMVGGIVH